MKSIRRNLTIRLLSGLAVLWMAAGVGVYLSARAGQLKAIDADLAVDSQLLRFLARGEGGVEEIGDEGLPGPERRGYGRLLQERVPAYQQEGSGSFYESWNSEGESLERSPSLGKGNLPLPAGEFEGEPEFSTVKLADGTRVRVMTLAVSSGIRGRGKAGRRRSADTTVISIGQSLESADETTTHLLGGIVVVGILAGAGMVLLVRTSLNRGLRPLRELSEQAGAIEVEQPDSRFAVDEVPEELEPISQRLNDLIDRIRKSFERERRFSADLAHEMRTPVAELKMMSEVALKWPEQDSGNTHAETLQIAEQLESTIETLLALARWESGEITPRSEPVDLAGLVVECWAPFQAGVEAKGISAEFEFSRQPVFETDPSMLRHILGNLLSNAADYTPEGGWITGSSDEGVIEVANATANLGPEEVEHLFDRYWRRDDARGDSRHVGLGLSLARACAEAMGCRLEAFLEGDVLSFRLRF